jgi:hypothetical protein
MAAGNLGGYQVITTVVKRLGGPSKALFKAVGAIGTAIVAVGTIGYRIGKQKGADEAVAAMTVQAERIDTTDASENPSRVTATKEYLVTKSITSNDGTYFAPGDRLRVMDSDGDAVMVERIGDANSPYWISRDFLESNTRPLWKR